MPPTFFDLNLLVNMVAKLGNICETFIKFDMLANSFAQFEHTLEQFKISHVAFNANKEKFMTYEDFEVKSCLGMPYCLVFV